MPWRRRVVSEPVTKNVAVAAIDLECEFSRKPNVRWI